MTICRLCLVGTLQFWSFVLQFFTHNQFKAVILIVMTTLASHPFVVTAKTYTMGAFVFPPLSMQKEGTTECYGPAIDITRRIIESAGHELDVLCAPASRIYKMMAQGKVDFTINIKSTQLLKPHTTFIEPRFTTIKLQLFEYDLDMPKIVSGIRGFDYLGYRGKLINEGYQFSDLATSDESITVFIKQRTKALLTYDMLINTYIESYLDNKLPSSIIAKDIITIGSHYGVSNHSPAHKEVIKILSDYAAEYDVTEFTDDI